MSLLTSPKQLGIAAVMAITLVACSSEPETEGGKAQLRRLSQEQYRQSIEDIFGKGISIPGRFEPEIRADGLVAVGSGIATITPSGFEQYEVRAHAIAGQVVGEEQRERTIPCQPKDVSAPDDACAGQVVEKYGRLLFRRPLTEAEREASVALAHQGAESLGDFYDGLQLSLAGMLVSPSFLFRVEALEPDPENKGEYRLDAYSKASRLSFFLWNTTPDEELLSAAEDGRLHSRDGLVEQVERMMGSPRYENGMRAFFSDMLRLDAMNELAKDPVIYPAYTVAVAQEAREQTLRTTVDLLLSENGDYRDLFTSRKTFMSRNLGRIYKVPVKTENGWESFEFPEDSKRVGLQSQLSFLALHSHPGRSSATLRGMALREIFLCQEVAPAPANVNFTVVQETDNPEFKTARERLTAHRTDPACTGCHEFIDPIGLALENFDGVGSHRLTENGAQIDPSGEVDGVAFEDSIGLGSALHELPQTTSCLVDRVYSYGVGRPHNAGEREWMEYMKNRFSDKGFNVPSLVKEVALSPAFYKVTGGGPEAAEPPGDAGSAQEAVARR